MILDWPACDNARDLGGLPTRDGGRIRPGALLRSGRHARITPATMAAIRATGVARVVDLRWDREVAADPSPFAGDPVYVHLPMLMDVLDYALSADRPAATMRNTLEHAERHYGGVVSYLRGSGVEQRHLDAVRTRLREPTARR